MMKSKKLVSAILAAASFAGGVVGAQAATIDDLAAKVQEQQECRMVCVNKIFLEFTQAFKV